MRTLLTTIGTALLAVSAVLMAWIGSASAATGTVQAQDFQFNPATINITAGDTVRWEFVGESEHTVTADSGSFDSGNLTSGTFTQTFNTAGSFAYYCELHGAAGGQGMAGTVVVAEAPSATNTPRATSTREPTDTPEATSTAAATSTPLPGASGTPVEAVPVSAPVEVSATPEGSTQAAVSAPRAGTGPAPGRGGIWRALALTALCTGVASLAAASFKRTQR